MKSNFTKKLLSGALSLLTALSAVPMNAYADETESVSPTAFSGTVYLADFAEDKITTPNPITNGFSIGSLTMRYADTETARFEKSIFNHAATNTAKRCTFDVSDYTAEDIAFFSYIGFVSDRGGQDTEKKGKAAFLLYADDTLLGKSDFLTAQSPLTEFSATVPAGTKTLSIEQDAGETADFDWCMWGNPKLTTAEKYLASFPAEKVTKPNPNSNGSETGSFAIRYNDTESRRYMQSVFNHAATNTAKRYSFDVSEYTSDAVIFSSYIGLKQTHGGGQDGDKKGYAAFRLYADDTLIKASGFMSDDSPLGKIIAEIPAGTRTVSFEQDAGEKADFDWSMWGDPKIYLSQKTYLTDLPSDKITPPTTGYNGYGIGSFDLRYQDIESKTFEKSVFNHAATDWWKSGCVYSFDVSDYTAEEMTFSSYIGLKATHGGGRDESKRGKAAFLLYADGVLLQQSDFLTDDSPLTEMKVTIPAGTQSIRLEQDAGETADFDWCMWGNPCIYPAASIDSLKEIKLICDKTDLEVGESTAVSVRALLESGADLVLSNGDITFESSDIGVVSVTEDGVICALAQGSAVITVTVRTVIGTASASLRIRCGTQYADLTRYLGDMPRESASVGWGNLLIDQGFNGNKIHFAGDITCEKGITAHAPSEITYDVTGLPILFFRATVGILDDEDPGKGLVKFKVYADDTLLYETAQLTNSDAPLDLDIPIPSGTERLRLVTDDCGKMDSDHSAWGNARVVIDGAHAKDVYSLSVSVADGILPVGGTTETAVSGKLVDGTAFTADDVTVRYASDNEGVFTVDANGSIYAVGDGVGTLTVTVSSGLNQKSVKTNVFVGNAETDTLKRIASPDGSRVFCVYLDENGTARYTVVLNGKTVVPLSELGFVTDKIDLTSGLELSSASDITAVNERYTLTARTKELYENSGNERTLTFEKNGFEMKLCVRVFNNGVAFRYILSASDGSSFTVNEEKTTVSISPEFAAWLMPYNGGYEGIVKKFEKSGISSGSSYNLSALLEDKTDDRYVLLTEAVFNPEYTGSHVNGTSDGNLCYTAYSNEKVTVSSPFTSPWRVLAVGSLAEITENSLVTDLSPDPDGSVDYSFAKPGISAWSWLTEGGSGQSNLAVHKKYVDYAADMGWQYYTLDDGWQPRDSSTYKITGGVYDWFPELVEYADSKGIGLIAWIHKINCLDENDMNAVLEEYKSLGIAGIKIDFFDSEAQSIMALYDRVYKKCAQLGLVVNCHGANKPTGEVRTYPNVMAREAVRGQEYRFDSFDAQQYTVLPFVRGTVGPADVTEMLSPSLNSDTTCGSLVAMSVLMASGIHYVGSGPEEMYASPAEGFYRNFPAVWDDTKLIEGKLGEYAAIMRRSGSVYYAAGITTEARTAKFTLDFLGDGLYFAELYCDGDDISSLIRKTAVVKKGDTVTVSMLRRGGATLRLTPIDELVLPESLAFENDKVILNLGETKDLSPVLLQGNKQTALLYSSSNEDVVRYEGGRLYAIGSGIATVRVENACDNTVYAECVVGVRRADNAVPSVAVSVPERIGADKPFTLSFDAIDSVSLEDIRLYNSRFEAVEILSRSLENGKVMLKVSLPYGDVLSVCDKNGTEKTFVKAVSEVVLSFDGGSVMSAASGERVTLPENTNENFGGWKYNDKTYAAGSSFAVPFGVATVAFTSTVIGENGEAMVYLDPTNGDDSAFGFSSENPVKTVEKAAELLSTRHETKVVGIIGTLTSSGSLPSGNMIYRGVRDAELVLDNNGLDLSGDTTFENLNFRVMQQYRFINTRGHALTFGDGITDNGTKWPNLVHSGTQGYNGGREHVTVNSGIFTVYAGTYYNYDTVKTTAGADYTVNGGDMTLIFRTDGYLADHKGAAFTDTVNVYHNGGRLAVTADNLDYRPISLQKPLVIVANYGSEPILSKLDTVTAGGMYTVLSEKYGNCHVVSGDTAGTFNVVCDDGVNAFVNGEKVENSFTVNSGETVSVTYRADKAAAIGNVLYDTLEEALSAAVENDTVTLLQSLTLNKALTVPNGVCVDFDLFTVGGEKLLLSKNATATGKQSGTVLMPMLSSYDGGIVYSVENGKSIYRVGTYTVENDAAELLGETVYTIDSDGRNGLTITYVENGITYNGQVSLVTRISGKNMVIAGGASAAVTIKENGSLTFSGGTIGTIYAENNTTVTLSGGKFDALYKQSKDASVRVNTTVGEYIFSGFDEENRARFITLSMYGMQLRISGKQGLRFIAELSGEYQNRDDFSYGLCVLPEDLIPSGEELTTETARCKVIESTDEGFRIFDEDGQTRLYTVCITDIAARHYNRRYTVRAFIRCQQDGKEAVVYSKSMSGSILEVISGLKEQYPGQYDDLYDTIMKDYSDTFLSAGEFKTSLTALAADGINTLPLTFTNHAAALSLSGESVGTADWSTTDYIELNQSTYPILQYCLSGKKGILSAAFYDENKQFISGIGSDSDAEYEILIYNAPIPEQAAYVRFSNADDFTLYRAEACKDIGKTLNEYSVQKDKTDLSGKKIVCVGDSLTYGDYGTTVHGKGYPHAENYPYYLAAYTGASVEWYACGGYTAKALANDYKDGVFSGMGRPGVSVSIKDADYIVVMLGTNGGLSLVEDRSNYDAYLSLATQLKKDCKEGARIVLMTPPHATTDENKVNFGYAQNVASAYAGVYKIADNLALPVFDVYRDAGFSAENESLFQPNDGLHFGGVGYGALAAFVANELRLLQNNRLSALSLAETVNKEDTAYLSTIEYPAYTLADGAYATSGRWFKKTVNGTECDVTLTSGSQLFFLTAGARTATVEFVSMTDDTPYYAVSIDGGDFVRFPATQNTINLPDRNRHVVRVVMDGIAENIGKWENENGYAVAGVTVDSGRIRAVMPTDDVIFYYGDSITEGVMSVNSGISCGENNSAVHSYAFESAKLLGAIPYSIGYGASGILSDGSFAKFADAMDHVSQSRADDGSVVPSEIIINHGYNDGQDIQDALRQALTKLEARYPDTKIYYVLPFAQRNADAIRTVCREFDAVTVIETDSLEVEYGSDGIHPTARGAAEAGEYIARAVQKARLSTQKYSDYIEYGTSLQNVNHKLLTEKSVNIAYYGGSITQGYGASDSANIWRNKTKEWFGKHYPDAEINEIYACFGESGTYLGTYLLDEYVLSGKPDLVFLEYAINDRYAGLTKEQSKRGYETIIRSVKEQYPKCDIVSLITIDYGTKEDAWYFEQAAAHAEIARAYNVPILFMGHALSEHIRTSGESWWKYFIDIVHPTDDGYAFYTDVICEFLNNELLAKDLPNTYRPDDTLPDLVSDYLIDGDRKLIQVDESALTDCDTSVWSWCPGNYLDDPNLRQKGFIAAKIEKNPIFVYTFTGTELALYTNIKNDAVGFTYTVDDGEEQSGFFKSHNPTPIVSGLSAGVHTIKIKPNENAAQTGISDWYISLILTRDESKQTAK